MNFTLYFNPGFFPDQRGKLVGQGWELIHFERLEDAKATVLERFPSAVFMAFWDVVGSAPYHWLTPTERARWETPIVSIPAGCSPYWFAQLRVYANSTCLERPELGINECAKIQNNSSACPELGARVFIGHDEVTPVSEKGE